MASTFLHLALLAAAAASARAESHTISFDNRCGRGTPQLVVGGAVVSNGSAYARAGALASGIAYLQTGSCLFNGEGCALVEFSMQNPDPAAPGSGSSADISLIAPHALNVPVAFSFYNGCDGQGKTCLTSPCVDAFYQPDDTWVQSACQTDDVDMKITFCPSGSGSAPSASSSSSSAPSSAAAPSSSSAAHTSAAAAAPTTASPASSAAPSSSASAAHSAAATSASAAAASAPPSRATSKSCKAKAQAGARKRDSARTPAKRAGAWHHRARGHAAR